MYGGTVESGARLCEGLVQAGENVTVYTTTANGKKELDVIAGKEYMIEGVKVTYFKRQTKDPLHFSYSLLKQVYKNCRQFDVVHIHSWWNIPAMVSAALCKMRKVKTVFSPHGMLSEYIISHSNSRIKHWLHSAVGASLLRYMILHATAAAELAECRQIIEGWKGAVIPNLIWLPTVEICKKQNEKFTLLFLSRIHPKKGLELLFEAMAGTTMLLCLQIAGTGDEGYIASLQQKAKALGIENKIEWLGWKGREEKFEVLAQADLFVLTSYNENFANVVIEALHTATPVLLTEGVGLSAFVQEQGLGWICKAEPVSIKAALEAAIAGKQKRNRITDVAPSIINANFSPAELVPQYQQLYAS